MIEHTFNIFIDDNETSEEHTVKVNVDLKVWREITGICSDIVDFKVSCDTRNDVFVDREALYKYESFYMEDDVQSIIDQKNF